MAKVLQIDTCDELMEVINSNPTVVVDFSAPAWCVPCKRLAPHFESAAGKSPDAVFVEVDIDKADDDITALYQIQSVPTVKIYKDGHFIKDMQARTTYTIIAEVQKA